MKLSDKGPIAPPPAMPGFLGELVHAIQSWPHVIAATHWDLYRPTVADGADFYVGDVEIGHLHFYGEAHVASDAAVAKTFIAQGMAQPFRFRGDANYRHWTQVSVTTAESFQHALALFRANYERIKLQAGL
jgi:hypothetical protein